VSAAAFDPTYDKLKVAEAAPAKAKAAATAKTAAPAKTAAAPAKAAAPAPKKALAQSDPICSSAGCPEQAPYTPTDYQTSPITTRLTNSARAKDLADSQKSI
jgi:hypothetical protein